LSYFDKPLVSAEWLQDRLGDPTLRVFDVTYHVDAMPSGLSRRSGRPDYQSAHIPGAGFLDVTSDLSDTESALAFTRPSAGQIEKVLSKSGVSDTHNVVIYSGAEMMWATRAWWLFRSAGMESVAVLDGGFGKWRAEGRPVCSNPCGYPEAEFRARPAEELWATKQEVLRAIEDGGVCTINALPKKIYDGEYGLGYARDGHIKGSLNVPSRALLVPDEGVLRPEDELRGHFAETGAINKERVITYCGGGIAATLNAFALVLLGHKNVAVYDGGLDEWSRDEGLPMENGESS
jgi:thiosulfate/3-mercaptopyruvate sulfurtransferase